MSFPEGLRNDAFLAWVWFRHHSFEILLAALFALPFAYMAGAWLEHPDPFVIYVVADNDTNKETLDIFRDRAKAYLGKMGDVDVEVQLKQLPENTEDAAKTMAEDLSGRSNTLMVIGSGRSQLIEKSLPVYFSAKPRVPYLATTASDDNLLANCSDECFEGSSLRSVWHKKKFVPLLQLSPTNKIQASSAIEYAVENGRRSFLIVSGNDSQNKAYTDNLVSEYEGAIQAAAKEGAFEINKFQVNDLPDDAKLRQLNPDCVFYAGNFGEAQTVFHRFANLKFKNNLMMMFSDAVIQTRGSDEQLANVFKIDSRASLLPVRFTHQTFATDYNDHVSTYDRDVFSIAKILIDDVNDRGIDFRMQFKTLFHVHSAKDARRNLNRVMKQNSEVRTWYWGEGHADERPNIYIFEGHNQYNGIFHIWQLQGPGKNPAQMDDVDHWHPGHGLASAQQSAMLSENN